jgi:hypothetical protein
MVAFEGSGQCREAQLHYHDFLQDKGIVPKTIADHIDGCAHCRAQVQRLAQMLGTAAEAGNPHRLNHSRELIAELQSHFEHVGEQIRCNQAKRYLPGLLSDRIRIPTPVTVHIDQCDQCTEDLERLRSLGLTQEQLATLGELYAEPAEVDLSLCRQVKLLLAETDDLRLEEIPAHLADHICSCPQCRGRIYEARQDLLDRCREHRTTDPYVGCGRIMAGDIFDFVVLKGTDPSGQTSIYDWHHIVAHHVFSCPKCLAKVQQMHRAIYGVAERADSGVTTVYTATGVVKPPTRKNRHSYADYPIDVQVMGGRLKTHRRRSGRVKTLADALKRGLQGRKLKTLIPAAAVTIVVALLVGIYIVTAQAASALNLRQIKRTQSKATNVHVTVVGRDGATILEDWISSSAGVFLREIHGRQNIYDVREHRKTTVAIGETPAEWKPREEAEYQGVLKSMRYYLESDFAMFADRTDLTRQDGSPEGTGSILDMYEIVSRRSQDESEQQRLLISLDSATKMLKRVESSRKFTAEGEWELQSIKQFDYPSESEILRHLSGVPVRN